MFRLAIFLAGVWGSAGSAAANADLSLIQVWAYTPSPTPGPTTPAPTFPPGVPCECLPPACFSAYDLNNDSCISQAECNLQVVLTACDTVEWNPDLDDCINITEFMMLNHTEICPVPPPPPACKCGAGEYINTNGGECMCDGCQGGQVRRRRALSCTDCPTGYFDAGLFDDCICQNEVFLMEQQIPNGTTKLRVSINPPNMAVGDNISVVTRMSGQVAVKQGPIMVCEGGDECREPAVDTAIVELIEGTDITISVPLSNSYARFDPVMLTCTSTDGTDISRKFSESCGGSRTCQCGFEQCDQYTMCDCSSGTWPGDCTCVRAGPYPDIPTPAPTVGAKGDPHLVNLQGEHFDINHGGEFTLLRIPQALEKPAEIELTATVHPEFEKPCTTYITQVEISGLWLGNKSAQVRCYLKDRPGKVKGTFLGARVLREADDEAEWDSIETFLSDAPEVVLSDPAGGNQMQVTLSKSQWFPKKAILAGVPTAAGMFTVNVRNPKYATGAKFVIRQDLPEQEHLNLAVQKLSALGRADVGGLLGFDEHPQSLEQVSSHCSHHRATEKQRIESVENNGYYFEPVWKQRWEKIREEKQKRIHEGENAGEADDADIDAAASLILHDRAIASSMTCKCPFSGGAYDEGVLVEESSATLFAQASWD